MKYIIRPARKIDEPFLWEMLYYAAHMSEDGAAPESARTNPDLAYYVDGWTNRHGDLGFIAMVSDDSKAGAAWIRVMPPSTPLYRFVPVGTPELAIATLPKYVGQGAGTELLTHLIPAARQTGRAIALSVRAENPARRLYERFGFRTVAQITNRVGTHSYLMELRFQ